MINGRKTFTTMSPALTYFLVGVWIEEKEAMGFFLIHRDTKGVSIEETWDVVGMRGTESHDLILDQVEVPDDMLVEVQKGPRGGTLNPWIAHIPSCYLGLHKRQETMLFSMPSPIHRTVLAERLANCQMSKH